VVPKALKEQSCRRIQTKSYGRAGVFVMAGSKRTTVSSGRA
jgi:hypothetical protein